MLLRRLAVEAVAFGAALFDAEDSISVSGGLQSEACGAGHARKPPRSATRSLTLSLEARAEKKNCSTPRSSGFALL